MTPTPTKREIREKIKDGVSSDKTYIEILGQIKHELCRDPTKLEISDIKSHFVKYSIAKWASERCEVIEKLPIKEVTKIIEKTNKAQRLEDLPSFCELDNAEIFDAFCKDYILDPQDRTRILEKFKSHLWNFALNTFGQYIPAQEYLDAFQYLLTECGIPKQKLISQLQLDTYTSLRMKDRQWNEFKEKLEGLLQSVDKMYTQAVQKLIDIHQKFWEDATESAKFIVNSKITTWLSLYTKPQVTMDASSGTLTCVGSAVRMSEVRELVSASEEKVRQVQVFSTDVVLSDCDLVGEIFQGVNFVVSATKLILLSDQTWDFSGKSGRSGINSAPPKSTKPLQNGMDGEDGQPGESGGNVHILISSLSGQGLLKVQSNGGDGGNGQKGGNGGDGVKGEDGDELLQMDKKRFKSIFPKMNKWSYVESASAKLHYIEKLVEFAKEEKGDLKKVEEQRSNGDYVWYYEVTFKKSKNDKRAQVGFSLYEGPPGPHGFGFHAWCFGFGGTSGSDGGYGGRGGRGGNPGYAGNISIVLKDQSEYRDRILLEHIDGTQGTDAEDGTQGPQGTPGRHGTDFAHVQTLLRLGSTTKYYEGSLIKKLGRSKTEPSPYCGFKQCQIHFVYGEEEVTRLQRNFTNQKFRTRAPIREAEKKRTVVSETVESDFVRNCQKFMPSLGAYTFCTTVSLNSKNTLGHWGMSRAVDDAHKHTLIRDFRESTRGKSTRASTRHLAQPTDVGKAPELNPLSILIQRLGESGTKQVAEFGRKAMCILDFHSIQPTTAFPTLEYLNLLEELAKLEYFRIPDVKLVQEMLRNTLKFNHLQDLDTKLESTDASRLGVLECLSQAEFISLITNDLKDDDKTTPEEKEGLAFLRKETLVQKYKFGCKSKFLIACIEKWKDNYIPVSSLHLMPQRDSTSSPDFSQVRVDKHLKAEKEFINEEAQRYKLGPEDIQKWEEILPEKLSKWVSRKDVLAEYMDMLKTEKTTATQVDFEIFATVHRLKIDLYIPRKGGTGIKYEKSVLPIQAALSTNEPLTKFKILLMNNRKFAVLETATNTIRRMGPVYTNILYKLHDYPSSQGSLALADKKNLDEVISRNRYPEDTPSLVRSISQDTFNNLLNALRRSSNFNDVTAKGVNIGIMSSTTMDSALVLALVTRFAWEGCGISNATFRELGLAVLQASREMPWHLKQLEWMVNSKPQVDWPREISRILIHQGMANVLQMNLMEWQQSWGYLGECGLYLLVEKVQSYIDRMKWVGTNVGDKGLTTSLTSISKQLESVKLSQEDCWDLIDLRLEDWPGRMVQMYIKNTILALKSKGSRDKCVYYAVSLNNEYPDFVSKSLKKLKQFGDTEIDVDKLNELFCNLYLGVWQVPEVMEDSSHFQRWYECIKHANSGEDEGNRGTARTEMMVWELIHKDRINTLSDSHLEEILSLLRQKTDYVNTDLDAWVANAKNSSRKPSVHEILFYIEEGIKVVKGFKLTSTQKVTAIAMLTGCGEKVLAQVATGEGKSLIVVVWCIAKCLLGDKCDVITSSPILAKRDAEENKEIYTKFGITVGHNASSEADKRKLAYKCDVVYGDISNFQRDYLLDKYYGENFLGKKSDLKLVNVMVDEVDSMLLDKGNYVLYLSHTPGGMEALNPVFFYIWKTINIHLDNGEGALDKVKKAVLAEMYPMITRDSLKGCSARDEIYTYLMEKDFVDSIGKIGPKPEIPILPDDLQNFQTTLEYIVRKELSRSREFVLPKHIVEFAELHLESWIQSALSVFGMRAGNEYVIDTASKSYVLPDKEPKVIIIDRDTGVDMVSSQWTNGLHQFLQLKHQCAFSTPSLKAVFISNISYFKKYKSINGLTGTLGSEVERKFLTKWYDVQFLNVPTAFPKKFEEHLPQVLWGKDKWQKAIVEQSTDIITQREKPRSVLVICESINQAEFIHNGFGSMNNVHVYTRSYEEFSILSGGDNRKELEPGHVIISTNLAGRGTDIKLSDELKANGGLVVILTYLPDNIRVEQQALGRAARMGQPGSGMLIINHEIARNPRGSSELNIIQLKTERDFEEVMTVSRIEKEFADAIGFEELLFEEFGKIFQKIKEQILKQCRDRSVADILLNSVLDKWAFWLDATVIKRSNSEEINTIKSNLGEQLQTWETCKSMDDYLRSVDSYTHLIAIGKSYLTKSLISVIADTLWNPNSRPEIAEMCFDKAMDLVDKSFWTLPKYYKALALLMKASLSNFSKTKAAIKSLLLEAEEGFRRNISDELSNIAVVTSVSNRICDKYSFLQLQAFKDQRQHIIAINQLFLQSISDILNPFVLPQHFQTSRVTSSGQLQELIAQLGEMKLVRNYSVAKLPSWEYLLEMNRLVMDIPQCSRTLWNHLSSTARDYGILAQDLYQVLTQFRKECKKDFLISYEETRKFFEKRLKIANRVEFYQGLVKAGMISGSRTIALVEDRKKFEEKVAQMKPTWTYYQCSFVENLVAYVDLSNGQSDDSFLIELALSHEEAMQDPGVRVLLKEGLLRVSKCGDWEGANKIPGLGEIFDHHYLLVKSDAIEYLNQGELSVPNEVVENLVTHLVKEGLLDTAGLILHLGFHNVDWAEFHFLKDDFINVIYCLCAYRVCELTLCQEIKDKQPNELIDIASLTEDPYWSLLNYLLYTGLLQRFKINRQGKWGKELREWIKSKIRQKTTILPSELETLFSRIGLDENAVPQFLQLLLSQKWVTRTTKLDTNSNDVYIYEVHIPKEFTLEKTDWECDKIHNFLVARGSLSEDSEQIILALDGLCSKLNLFQEPDGTLEPIESKLVLAKKTNLEGAVRLAQMYKMESVIVLCDRRWSRSMFIRTVGVSCLGVFQIAVGVAVSVYTVGFGAYLGEVLIDQGISDICFALSGILYGQLEWEDYTKHKMSLESWAMSFVAPALSIYMSVGGHLGHRVLSRSVITAKGAWMNQTRRVGVQLGQAILRMLASNSVFALTKLSLEREINENKEKLVDNLRLKCNKWVTKFLNKEVVQGYCGKVGLATGLDILLIQMEDEDFGKEHWDQVEERIRAYADSKLKEISALELDKKYSSEKVEFYKKALRKLFEDSVSSKDKSLVKDIRHSVKSLLHDYQSRIVSLGPYDEEHLESYNKDMENFLSRKYKSDCTTRMSSNLGQKLERMLEKSFLLLTKSLSKFADEHIETLVTRQVAQSHQDSLASVEMRRSVISLKQEMSNQDSTVDDQGQDPVDNLRLKRFLKQLFIYEKGCKDPKILGEFVDAEISRGEYLIQACAHFFECNLKCYGCARNSFVSKPSVPTRRCSVVLDLSLMDECVKGLCDEEISALGLMDQRVWRQREILKEVLGHVGPSEGEVGDVVDLKDKLVHIIRCESVPLPASD